MTNKKTPNVSLKKQVELECNSNVRWFQITCCNYYIIVVYCLKSQSNQIEQKTKITY